MRMGASANRAACDPSLRCHPLGQSAAAYYLATSWLPSKLRQGYLETRVSQVGGLLCTKLGCARVHACPHARSLPLECWDLQALTLTE